MWKNIHWRILLYSFECGHPVSSRILVEMSELSHVRFLAVISKIIGRFEWEMIPAESILFYQFTLLYSSHYHTATITLSLKWYFCVEIMVQWDCCQFWWLNLILETHRAEGQNQHLQVVLWENRCCVYKNKQILYTNA